MIEVEQVGKRSKGSGWLGESVKVRSCSVSIVATSSYRCKMVRFSSE